MTIVAIPVRDDAVADAGPAQPHDEAPPPVALERTAEGDFWHGVVRALVQAEAVGGLPRELARQSQLLAREEAPTGGALWHLRVASAALAGAMPRERLQAALHAAGHAVTVQLSVGPVSDSPALRVQAATARRQRQAEALLHDDPYVQQLMREWGATIVSGSVKPL